MLTIDHVSMEFSARPVLDDITFLINRKERVALVGKNGAQGSTNRPADALPAKRT